MADQADSICWKCIDRQEKFRRNLLHKRTGYNQYLVKELGNITYNLFRVCTFRVYAPSPGECSRWKSNSDDVGPQRKHYRREMDLMLQTKAVESGKQKEKLKKYHDLGRTKYERRRDAVVSLQQKKAELKAARRKAVVQPKITPEEPIIRKTVTNTAVCGDCGRTITVDREVDSKIWPGTYRCPGSLLPVPYPRQSLPRCVFRITRTVKETPFTKKVTPKKRQERDREIELKPARTGGFTKRGYQRAPDTETVVLCKEKGCLRQARFDPRFRGQCLPHYQSTEAKKRNKKDVKKSTGSSNSIVDGMIPPENLPDQYRTR